MPLFGRTKKTDNPKEKKVEAPAPQKMAILPSKVIRVAHRLLNKPIITEKAAGLEAFNQYVFEVPVSANKIEIKKAVKELYNVDPLKVRIVKVKGKAVRYGKSRGQTRDWKKAIITIKKGQKIEFAKKE